MAAALSILCVPAKARDDGRYANSPNKDWFSHQHNLNGTLCCDVADGQRVDDADWKTDDKGQYWVRLNGEWRVVPEHAIINPKTRPIDYAVVWIYQGNIMCFLVGSGT